MSFLSGDRHFPWWLNNYWRKMSIKKHGTLHGSVFFYVKSDQAEYWSSNYSSKKMPMVAEMAMYKTGCFLKRQSAYHIMTARRMHFQSKKDRIFGAGISFFMLRRDIFATPSPAAVIKAMEQGRSP